MVEAAWTARGIRRRGLVVAGLALAIALLVVALGAVTMAWGDSLREQDRLLPGTTVAGVDVGGGTIEDAVAAVRAEVADDLDREVEIVHADRTWTTSGGRLGATSDVDQTVAAAFEHVTRAGLLDLARHRFGRADHGDHGIELDVPREAVADLVASIAGEVDTAAEDAVVTWEEDRAVVEEAVTGRRVQQEDAVEAVATAIEDGAAQVTLAVEEAAPTVGTDRARGLADEVTGLVTDALDREVTVVLRDTRRVVTPRQLGAAHNAEALIAAGDPAPADVELEISEDALAEVVDDVAAGHERAPRDASLTWSKGAGLSPTPGATGLAVDDEAARADLRRALQGDGGARVELELATTQPRITTDRFDQVLLVRQAERRVDLHRGGEVVRSWSVAVGTGDHPTPTGMFTVGWKRHEPTWVNPSPDSWGNDMPARIGPGPTNPLGLRALNWNRDGRDTLIRFHGTANEDSIGQAASHGCVRMRNPDVIELYDLVPEGTVIVSAP